MLPPYEADRIEGWASEFPESTSARAFPQEALAWAPQILSEFLKAAALRAGGEAGDVAAEHLSAALLQDLPKLAVPDSVRPQVPAMLKAFLTELEDAGRLAGGRSMGLAVAAAGGAYLAAGGKPAPIRRPGAKIGPNESCPCGSGRKYKRCCGT